MKYLRRLIILFVALVVLFFSYNTNQERLLEDFKNKALSTKEQVNQYTKISSDFIDLMGTYGIEYFKQPIKQESPYFSALTYDQSWDGFSLDKAEFLGYDGMVGNLTGKGPIPEGGEKRDELLLALNYNTYFDTFYKSMEGIAWIYYTSESGFVNLYPWVSSKDVKYSKEMLANEYMVMGRHQREKGMKTYWSKIYTDLAGKGRMITISKAIFQGENFKGVVSLDFTLDRLNKLLPEDYKVYLVDEYGEVVATNDAKLKNTENPYVLDDYFKNLNGSEMEKLKYMPEDEVQPMHGGYAYLLSFSDVPWKLYFVVPGSALIGKVLAGCLPVLIIVMLLFYVTSEAEARKKTERELEETVEKLEASQEKLEKTATVDFLTGALNRRGAFKRLEEECAVYQRKKQLFSLIMLDIDHFKYFNDQYGHRAGDMVLIKSCHLIQENIRVSDLMCRWGGEEFLIVLFDTEMEQALNTAEKLREEIQKARFPWENEDPLSITMTFGVTEYDEELGLELSIANADMAMYEGKKRGRNRVIGRRKSHFLNTDFTPPVI